MFLKNMPWPMTVAPTNEAIRHENHAVKNLIVGKRTITAPNCIEEASV
jgi:hypothetical protein